MIPRTPRRRFLAALGTAAVAATAGCNSTSASDDEAADAAGGRTDWPTLGHDGANAGYNPKARGPRADADSGTTRWTLGIADNSLNSPVVAGETLYVGDEAGTMYAIETGGGTGFAGRRFGAVRWRPRNARSTGTRGRGRDAVRHHGTDRRSADSVRARSGLRPRHSSSAVRFNGSCRFEEYAERGRRKRNFPPSASGTNPERGR
ncbi:PQQ-binding-like beta-propeller repeat protein [Haladaptatus salinisoli]|uniref:PQQ-binding-like beta-propeller repeat protein n=1 Tax=Haladaptatus salinisoli TaxID=2884876 RepID=UPI001D0B628F|nr:PQQ-binding-like beta-propeller repeat protein [Haladaptatus salinisoli]